MAQVRLEWVSKRFGAEPAVDEVSFTAEAGTLVVLLGPSGCGKSTTLCLIPYSPDPARRVRQVPQGAVRDAAEQFVFQFT